MTVGDESEGERRLGSFQMLSPENAVAAGTAAGSYEADYFATLSDEELEQTFGGVAVLITDTERATFEALPPDAKRRYLTEFFQRLNPNPGSPGNLFLEDYLSRISTIRARYDEQVGTEERMPWYTDRGRIYLMYGEPQDRVVNYSPSDLGGSLCRRRERTQGNHPTRSGSIRRRASYTCSFRTIGSITGG